MLCAQDHLKGSEFTLDNCHLPLNVQPQGVSLLQGLRSDLSISRNAAITSMDKKIHLVTADWRSESNTGAVCVCDVQSNYITL